MMVKHYGITETIMNIGYFYGNHGVFMGYIYIYSEVVIVDIWRCPKMWIAQ
jgi:hypothetical protein